MPEILKGSIIISLVMKICKALTLAYNNSVLKRFFAKVDICFKHSFTRKVLSAYANKKPWFRYSLTYKLIMLIVKVIDIIFGFIYKLIKKCLFGSFTAFCCKNAASMSLTDKCYSIGVLLISVPVGAMIAALVFGTGNMLTMVLSWIVFAGGVMVVIVGIYGKDSIIVRFIRGLWTALR